MRNYYQTSVPHCMSLDRTVTKQTGYNWTVRIRRILQSGQGKYSMCSDNGKLVTKTDLHCRIHFLIQGIVNRCIVTKVLKQTVDQLADAETDGFVTSFMILHVYTEQDMQQLKA